jgi:hypothetical protein
MRMMMLVDLPLEPFNSAVRNGTAVPKLKQILDDAKPEAVYFGEREGRRSGVIIVNLNSPSEIPKFAEPWFLTFNAEVEFRVAMTPDDLAHANIEALGKKWG